MVHCWICGEGYSALRHSTPCSLCLQTFCSSCCRPSPNNPSARICFTCAKRQKKSENPNDDRPKWLREAQELRKSDAARNPSAPPPSVNIPIAPSSKKQNVDDDRPKWLREAQDQRTTATSVAGQATHPHAALPLPTVVLPGPNSEIESRLAKLKQEMSELKPAMTENELSDRVARLRDMDPRAYAASRQPDHSVIQPQPRRTEAEEIEELVAQMKERAILDDLAGDADLIAELEQRLNRLKAESATLGITNLPLSAASSPRIRRRDISPGGKAGRSKKQRLRSVTVPNNDSDEEAERVTKMLTAQLPEVADVETGDDNQDDWFCVICPEDPTLICVDCENDKYCDRCFRECHREWAAMDHKTKRLPKMKSSY